jgi:hypothetical protein
MTVSGMLNCFNGLQRDIASKEALKQAAHRQRIRRPEAIRERG